MRTERTLLERELQVAKTSDADSMDEADDRWIESTGGVRAAGAAREVPLDAANAGEQDAAESSSSSQPEVWRCRLTL